MGFLTPLYLAGALAISLPILFHLIRRTPRGETAFSSLMFLSPSPPRVTRRSRLEHLLLLALRGLAIALTALAFARPFWRTPALASASDDPQGGVAAIVVDSSASMRRGDLWQQALAVVDEELAKCSPQDRVAVFTCDESLRLVAGFDELVRIERPRRRPLVKNRLESLGPTWSGTHLGQAVVDAVAATGDRRDTTEEAGRAPRRIVLVSDMQSGSRLSVLGDSPWPVDARLQLRKVAVNSPTNAGLQRLSDESLAERRLGSGEPQLRVLVANAAVSQAADFQLQWSGVDQSAIGEPVNAHIPPGESRVIRVPRPTASTAATRLVLTGDDADFDNTLFVVPARREQLTVSYLGDDTADDPQRMRYYLERAIASNLNRSVTVRALTPGAELTLADATRMPLVVAPSQSTSHAAALRKYASAGGTVLYVLGEDLTGNVGQVAQDLAALLDSHGLALEEAAVDRYTMLGEIDFANPLFASMAGPKFNDFTKIRFWKYRRLQLNDGAAARVIARFENGDAAIVDQPLGKGRILVMTSGWQPSDSQLARSWKFLLMLSSLVDGDHAGQRFRTEYLVNERAPLPDRSELAAGATVTKPDGSKVQLGDAAQTFADATAPGLYKIDGVRGPLEFAVNLDPVESDTTPLTAEDFERLGCRMVGLAEASPQDASRLQDLRDAELEGRQRVWQRLLAAALGVLVFETWLAGRLSKADEAPPANNAALGHSG